MDAYNVTNSGGWGRRFTMLSVKNSRKGTTVYCWRKNSITSMENGMGGLRKLKIELWYYCTMPLLSMCPKEIKSVCQRDIIHNNQEIETVEVFIKWWMDKVWYTYTMEHFTTIKKWHYGICNSMNRYGTHYVKWNKSDENHMDFLMWNLRQLSHRSWE